MTGRSHLSIGEVLSLLQEEFPDVTISKIRFLESQGLVDPERTPSGYRKFYEPDIERLRWVLRQQRDAFLPLKVIKGRLEEQDEDVDGQPALEGFEDVRPRRPAEALEAAEAGEGVLGTGVGEATVVVHELTVERYVEAEAVSHDEPVPDAGSEAHGRRRGLGNGSTGPASSGPASTSAAGTGPAGTSAASSGPAGTVRGPHRPGDGTAQLFDALAEEVPSRRPGPPTQRHPSRAGLRAGTRSAAPPPVDEDLSLEELLQRAEVDAETVRDLEHYGLVNPKMIGGAPYYNADAAIIARLAGAFARHGVEARHLRAYKGAAEREAGLVQQVIMPLIRQRNPQARQAAGEAVEELSRLGGELRAVLLRSALSDLH